MSNDRSYARVYMDETTERFLSNVDIICTDPKNDLRSLNRSAYIICRIKMIGRRIRSLFRKRSEGKI